MNGYSRRDRKSGDAKVAGLSRSPLLWLPIQSEFFGHGKNQELLLPSASDCAGSGAIAKDQRRRLDEERLAGFNHSADLSTHRRKNSVRTTRATALRRCGLINVVFSSSCATYGGVHDHAIDENAEQHPLSTYGFSKLVVERMLADYGRAFGFRSLALRYFNAAGADPDGELGECHDPEPHFVPRVLRVAAGFETSIEINGTDYPTPDGTCVRDYVHVHDLAQGHVLALQGLLDGGIRGALNLGTGCGSSLLEIVRLAEHVTNSKIVVRFGTRRAGDPACAVADASLAARTLRWTPTYTNMHEMLLHAWTWLVKTQRSSARETNSPPFTAPALS